MSKLIIRAAEKADVPAVCALYPAFFSAMAAYEPGYFQPGDADRVFLEQLVSGEEGGILLALKDEALLGFAALQIQQAPAFPCMVPHRYAYLMDLAVRPDRQGGGVGTCLLAAARDWTMSQGLDYLELCVLERNRRAKQLYERFGFRTVLHTMRLEWTKGDDTSL